MLLIQEGEGDGSFLSFELFEGLFKIRSKSA